MIWPHVFMVIDERVSRKSSAKRYKHLIWHWSLRECRWVLGDGEDSFGRKPEGMEKNGRPRHGNQGAECILTVRPVCRGYTHVSGGCHPLLSSPLPFVESSCPLAVYMMFTLSILSLEPRHLLQCFHVTFPKFQWWLCAVTHSVCPLPSVHCLSPDSANTKAHGIDLFVHFCETASHHVALVDLDSLCG